AVQFHGTAFVATEASEGDPPPSRAWNVLAARGSDGAAGPAGPQGPQGATGAPGYERTQPLPGTTATLDATRQRAMSTTMGSDGLGLITYYDQAHGDLRVAHCSNTPCSSSTTATLDSGGDVGGIPSVAVGPDGLGLISYYDRTNHDLKVAHCSN